MSATDRQLADAREAVTASRRAYAAMIDAETFEMAARATGTEPERLAARRAVEVATAEYDAAKARVRALDDEVLSEATDTCPDCGGEGELPTNGECDRCGGDGEFWPAA